MTEPLISVKHLTKRFSGNAAVSDVSFDIFPGETLGLVGESGCGKTTIGRILVQLEEASEGKIFIGGKEYGAFSKDERRHLKKELQVIFQDPYSSLNPRMTLKEILEEPLIIHKLFPKAKRRERVDELLHLVGLDKVFANRYPHEISGGQRQRIGIARALAVGPKFIVCDEPISALDVSIQAQIVNLLKKFQEEHGFAYLFISHDLSMVKYISHRIAVMYAGRIVELSEAHALYERPLHPYTQLLLSAIFIPDPKKKNERAVISSFDDRKELTEGCPFASRCPCAKKICFEKSPAWKTIDQNHSTACHLY